METAELRALETTTRYGPPVANLVLVILIGIALARLVWLVVPSPASNRTQPPQQTLSTKNPQSHGPNLAAIKKAHLFGLASAGSTGKAPVNAPETHLNLTLDGVIAWNIPKLSRVLIRGSNGKEHHYSVGDTVTGGATISAIYPDRVILKRGGGYETLRLVHTSASQVNHGSAGGTNTTLGSAIRNHDYGKARDLLLQHPNEVSRIMRVQPAYRNGQLQGYRVYPGTRRTLFLDLGLRPGDLVTSINGVKLDNPHKALSLLQQVKQANKLNVTVNRLGKTENLTLSLQ